MSMADERFHDPVFRNAHKLWESLNAYLEKDNGEAEITRLEFELAKAQEDTELLDAYQEALHTLPQLRAARRGYHRFRIDKYGHLEAAYSGQMGGWRPTLRDALRDLRDRNEDAADLAEAEQALREVDALRGKEDK